MLPKPGNPLGHEVLLDSKLVVDFLVLPSDLVHLCLAVVWPAGALKDNLDPLPELGVLAGDQEIFDLHQPQVPLLDLVVKGFDVEGQRVKEVRAIEPGKEWEGYEGILLSLKLGA